MSEAHCRDEWLLTEHVENRAADSLLLQRSNERFLGDDSTAREVRDDCAASHHRELGCADHSLCLGRERRVHSDDIDTWKKVSERSRTRYAQQVESLVGHVRIVSGETSFRTRVP